MNQSQIFHTEEADDDILGSVRVKGAREVVTNTSILDLYKQWKHEKEEETHNEETIETANVTKVGTFLKKNFTLSLFRISNSTFFFRLQSSNFSKIFGDISTIEKTGKKKNNNFELRFHSFFLKQESVVGKSNRKTEFV